MLNHYPLFIIIFDIIFGILLWSFILKFFLNLFFANETNIKLVSKFFSITDSFYKKVDRIIPKFLPLSSSELMVVLGHSPFSVPL